MNQSMVDIVQRLKQPNSRCAALLDLYVFVVNLMTDSDSSEDHDSAIKELTRVPEVLKQILDVRCTFLITE